MMNKMLTNPAPMLNSKPPAKGAPIAKKMIESMTLVSPNETAEIRSRFENIAINVKTNIIINKRALIIMKLNASRLN
jgi:hypothetical protein